VSFDDDADADDQPPFSRPPHPDDRLWRHPSELGDHPLRPIGAPFVSTSAGRAAASVGDRRRRRAGVVAAVGAAGVVVVGIGAAVLGWGDDAPPAERADRLSPTVVEGAPAVDAATLAAVGDAVAPSVVAVTGVAGVTGAARQVDPTAPPTSAGAAGTRPPSAEHGEDGGDTGDTGSSGGSGSAGGTGGTGQDGDSTGAARSDGGGGTGGTGQDGGDTGPATGSGVIVRPEGIVVTTAELVGDGSGPVAVRLPDGTSTEASVVGVDRLTGVGILDLPGGGYPTAGLGVATGLAPGGDAFTVGAGDPGTAVAASGAVGTNQRLVGEDESVLEAVVALDGRPAAGALGGPVVDATGTVLGVTASIGSGRLAYVTPVDVVNKVTGDVLAGGVVHHTWLGIRGLDRAAEPGGAFGLLGDHSGAVLETVTPGGPAADAGLRVGDVVVAVDGQPIEDMAGLVRWLRPCQPGQVVEMTIERDGTPSTVAVTLGEASSAGTGD